MKEYMVQMKPANPEAKWQRAHKPNNANHKVFDNYMEAVEFMDRVIILWDQYEEKWKKHDEGISENLVPRKYRILKREVSEWEEV